MEPTSSGHGKAFGRQVVGWNPPAHASTSHIKSAAEQSWDGTCLLRPLLSIRGGMEPTRPGQYKMGWNPSAPWPTSCGMEPTSSDHRKTVGQQVVGWSPPALAIANHKVWDGTHKLRPSRSMWPTSCGMQPTMVDHRKVLDQQNVGWNPPKACKMDPRMWLVVRGSIVQ